MGIELGKIWLPGLYIGFAPIILTFILGTIYNMYLGMQSQGKGDPQDLGAKTAAFVNSKLFTGLTWAALAIMAFLQVRALSGVVTAGTLLVNGLVAAVLGLVVKTVVEVVFWKHDDMKKYWTLAGIQAVLALVAAALGALLG